MPIPLIPVVIVGAVAAVGAVASVIRPKSDEPRKLAILGGEQTGKTTLLAAMKRADSATAAGSEAEEGSGDETESHTGTFEVKTDDGAILIEVSNDVDGAARAKFTAWKDAFFSADVVLYLFRADRIRAQDAQHIQAVKSDLDMMKDWGDTLKSKAPKVVLVGTWADQSDEFTSNPERFAKQVRASDPIKLGRSKFAKKAPVHVGSLSGDRALALIDDIASGLILSTRRSKRNGS